MTTFLLHQMGFLLRRQPRAGRLCASHRSGRWSSFTVSKSRLPGQVTPSTSSACASTRPTLRCRPAWPPTVTAAACAPPRSPPRWNGTACPAPMKARCVLRPIPVSSPAVTSAAIWWRRVSAAASARCSTTGWWRASPASCRSAGRRWPMPWAGFGAPGARRCWRIRAVTAAGRNPALGAGRRLRGRRGRGHRGGGRRAWAGGDGPFCALGEAAGYPGVARFRLSRSGREPLRCGAGVPLAAGAGACVDGLAGGAGAGASARVMDACVLVHDPRAVWGQAA